MRRFAKLDATNTVRQVIVADSLEWCEKNIPGVWVETFKDRSQRLNYAALGFTYDVERDAFIPPKPFDSWILDEATCLWIAPIPRPDGAYLWNEESVSWEKTPKPFESWSWSDSDGDWTAPTPMPEDGEAYVWDEETTSWVVSE